MTFFTSISRRSALALSAMAAFINLPIKEAPIVKMKAA